MTMTHYLLHNIKQRKTLWVALILMIPVMVSAQRIAKVSGKASVTLTDNDGMSLMEAKSRCVERARAEAIRNEFGDLITSATITTDIEQGGEVASFIYDNATQKARGNWLSDTREPIIDVVYADGKLTFTAQVWGEAREIVQATPQFKWKILCGGTTDAYATTRFNNRDRLCISFQAPADGYVAIYLIEGTDEVSCLLPWASIASGQFRVKGNQRYVFFDKSSDPDAPHYLLTTKKHIERNQIVVIYSPNPFTKSVDTQHDSRHANTLSSLDYQRWLLHNQRIDASMTIDTDWVTIINEDSDL